MVYQDSFEMAKLTDMSNYGQPKKKWTLYLIFCCITASLFSFQFGFNIASNNSPAETLKLFINTTGPLFLFKEYYEKKPLFLINEQWLNGNKSLLAEKKIEKHNKETIVSECLFNFFDLECPEKVQNIKAESEKALKDANQKYNQTFESNDDVLRYADELLTNKTMLLEDARVKLENGRVRIERATEIIWTMINGLFVAGGLIGALTSKYVLDFLGRKKGIFFNGLFTLVGGILVFIAFYAKSPVCLIISRFLFGIQGGMACSLVPTYLSEISPNSLRGQTGVMPQLFITIGILVGQVLGIKNVLGNENLWNFLIGFPIFPALIGLVALLFCPESPKTLVSQNFVEAARRALAIIRNDPNVDEELRDICNELNTSSKSDNLSILEVLRKSEIRWPLITALVIQAVQQLCGINAIFFYSSEIFGKNLTADYVDYAVVLTGLVNVIATIVCVPLIDTFGRRPLLIFPMCIIVIDFILLTIFLALRDKHIIFVYLSVSCIMIFIICYAVGLGPIPFIYTAECFRQNERSSAMALAIFTNWLCALFLTLGFPFMRKLLEGYVFLVFMGVVVAGVSFIFFKVPETKGKSADQIVYKFNNKFAEFIPSTNV